jgi:hypothetical protein
MAWHQKEIKMLVLARDGTDSFTRIVVRKNANKSAKPSRRGTLALPTGVIVSDARQSRQITK